jgi:hypothetical protein
MVNRKKFSEWYDQWMNTVHKEDAERRRGTRHIYKMRHVPISKCFTEREWDHMNHCIISKELWPLMILQRVLKKEEIDTDELAKEFLSMTDRKRCELHKKLKYAKITFFHDILYKRVPNAFNEFVSQRYADTEAKNFGFARNNLMASIAWKNMNSEEKQPYQEKANEARIAKKNIRKNLPNFLKRELRLLERFIRHLNPRPVAKRRRKNPWINFCQTRWTVEKKKNNNQTYKEYRRLLSEEWNNMNESEKEKYNNAI